MPLTTILLIIFISLVGLYCLAALGMYLFQRRFLYQPKLAALNYLNTNSTITHKPNIRFTLNDQQQMQGWQINPGQANAIIYYGGNAEAVEQNIELFGQLFASYTTYLIPYRSYSGNTGKPSEVILYNDALEFYDQLESQYQSISVIGRSLGTGVATFTAANRNVERLFLVTPYDSIVQVALEKYPYLPMPFLVRDKFLSIERAPKIKCPTFIITAEQDMTISKNRSDRLIEAFDPEILTHLDVKGAGHNNIRLRDEYAQALKVFFNGEAQ
jgi:uncharacterized protein